MNAHTQRMISKGYDCPLAKKHVNLQIRQTVQHREPQCCSSVGECGCGVVKIVYGMSYAVDWKKCELYSTITEQ